MFTGKKLSSADPNRRESRRRSLKCHVADKFPESIDRNIREEGTVAPAEDPMIGSKINPAIVSAPSLQKSLLPGDGVLKAAFFRA